MKLKEEYMTEQENIVLESAIGEMGAEPQLGKLKHKSVYGQQEDLSKSEQDKLDSFIARTSKHRTMDDTPITQGWIPIDKSEMGWRANFYPESWEFMIRPATIQAIKNWTAIDEEDQYVMNRVFNEICKTCIKINTNSNQGASWGQIRSWDRFWFILKVREYTYAQGQTNIEFEDECSSCNEEITYKLTSGNLFYEFPDEDLIEKYWTGEVWEIDPREYDVDHLPITLYTPTLAKDEAIINWGIAKRRSGGNVDENFIKFLVWMLPKASSDMQLLDRQIQKIYKEYKGWDLDMFSFMNDVVNNITINQSEKLKVTCPCCGQEATSTVQFPNGVKVLFEVKSNAKKFGSR